MAGATVTRPGSEPDPDGAPGTGSLPASALGIVSGVVAGGMALGVGELVAGLASSLESPLVAVANSFIDRTPSWLKSFAIDAFGTNDKVALIIGTLILAVVFAAGLGFLARTRRRLAVAGIVAFGLLGVAATLESAGAGPADALPSLFAAVAGGATLWYLATVTPRVAAERGTLTGETTALTVQPMARRSFLVTAGALAVVAGAAAAGGRELATRFSAAESRRNVTLPRAAEPREAVPDAVSVEVDGVTPFVTPNDTFYRIDRNLTVPQVPTEDWTLRVTGMVDRELSMAWEDVMRRELVEADITMTCVSNPVGGDLVGNARWLGFPVRELLDEAGVSEQADQIVGRSVDGYTCGYPLDFAYDRMSMVVVGMNSEPLPIEHGFPARLITPGIYGYVGATKWLTEIELTTFEAFDQYWVPRGYAERAPIKTQTRIDVPKGGFEELPAGDIVVAGVAWAQTRGIQKVEVSLDDGPFEEAELAGALNDITWRQWRHQLRDVEPGNHSITARATDGTGEVQTERRAEPIPDGASGRMTVNLTVEEA